MPFAIDTLVERVRCLLDDAVQSILAPPRRFVARGVVCLAAEQLGRGHDEGVILFDAVYLDADQQTIAEVRIKPDYTPLFAASLTYRGGTDRIRTGDLDIDSVAC